MNFHPDRHNDEEEGEEVLIPGSFMFDIRIMVTYNEREKERYVKGVEERERVRESEREIKIEKERDTGRQTDCNS